MINIEYKLLKDIKDYCLLNDLDLDNFINNLLKKSFMIEKYGERPGFMNKDEKEQKKFETKTEEPVIEKPKKERKPRVKKVVSDDTVKTHEIKEEMVQKEEEKVNENPLKNSIFVKTVIDDDDEELKPQKKRRTLR